MDRAPSPQSGRPPWKKLRVGEKAMTMGVDPHIRKNWAKLHLRNILETHPRTFKKKIPLPSDHMEPGTSSTNPKRWMVHHLRVAFRFLDQSIARVQCQPVGTLYDPVGSPWRNYRNSIGRHNINSILDD